MEEVAVTVPSNGEVTNAELARRLDAFQKEIHADFAELARRMDAYVLREVYSSDQARREEQIQGLKQRQTDETKARERELDRLRAQTRWLWTAVIMPVAALLISVLMRAGG